MKFIFAFIFATLVGLNLSAQDQIVTSIEFPNIVFAEYPMQIKVKKANLDKLEAPMAISNCKLSEPDLQFTFEDAVFSGGKHGTIERTWIATDACNNEAKTVQYIVVKD